MIHFAAYNAAKSNAF